MTGMTKLSSIDGAVVDRIVIGAMALLTEADTCAPAGSLPMQEDDVRVAVYCDEHQQCAVLLRCDRTLAVQLAGSMLELEPDDIFDADLLDATGELVNVIAGNLRGLVALPGAMSAPFALDQQEYALFSGAATNTYTLREQGLQIVRV